DLRGGRLDRFHAPDRLHHEAVASDLLVKAQATEVSQNRCVDNHQSHQQRQVSECRQAICQAVSKNDYEVDANYNGIENDGGTGARQKLTDLAVLIQASENVPDCLALKVP